MVVPKKEDVAGCCGGWVPKKPPPVAAGCWGAVDVVLKSPPDGAEVVVVVEKEKGAGAGVEVGAVVLGAKRPPEGAALEVAPVFKLRPAKGDGVVPVLVLGFCDVDGSKIDLRFPCASVVGLRFRPPKGLFDDGAPNSDISSGLVEADMQRS